MRAPGLRRAIAALPTATSSDRSTSNGYVGPLPDLLQLQDDAGGTLRLTEAEISELLDFVYGVEVDGDVAVFAQGARALRCRRAPDLTSALRAASLGAVFRGQGNEPGWSVDVYPERLAWVGAWGGDR